MASQTHPSTGYEHSLDHAIGAVALQVLAKMTPADFLASLQRQGISSLEDLATKSLETARSAVQAGTLAVDPEVFGVCYKFSSYRPHFSPNVINDVVNIVQQEIGR